MPIPTKYLLPQYSYTLSLKLRVCNGYSVIKLHYYIEGLENNHTLGDLKIGLIYPNIT